MIHQSEHLPATHSIYLHSTTASTTTSSDLYLSVLVFQEPNADMPMLNHFRAVEL